MNCKRNSGQEGESDHGLVRFRHRGGLGAALPGNRLRVRSERSLEGFEGPACMSIPGRSFWTSTRFPTERTARPTRDCEFPSSIRRDFASRSIARDHSAAWPRCWECKTSRWATTNSTRRSSSRATTSPPSANCWPTRGIRQTIQALPRVRLEIKDNEGWFGAKFPDDADELLFLATGVIKDVAVLKLLFELFATMLDQFCRVRITTKQDPGVCL